MIRRPAVAGTFYPASSEELYSMIARMIPPIAEKRKAKGVIAPHAGYIYSGRTAAKVFASVEIPDTVIIMAPNHTGMGKAAALWPSGEWEIPGARVPVNSELASLILENSRVIEEDYQAHLYEHAAEVEVPFLYYLNRNITIVPIVPYPLPYDYCVEIGTAIVKSIKEYGKEVLIVASSDMTHYESAESAKTKDSLALEKILALDPEGLYRIVREYEITMCGFIPATIMLISSIQLGATKATLIDYTNSGEVTGDFSSVVAYAGVVVE